MCNCISRSLYESSREKFKQNISTQIIPDDISKIIVNKIKDPDTVLLLGFTCKKTYLIQNQETEIEITKYFKR